MKTQIMDSTFDELGELFQGSPEQEAFYTFEQFIAMKETGAQPDPASLTSEHFVDRMRYRRRLINTIRQLDRLNAAADARGELPPYEGQIKKIESVLRGVHHYDGEMDRIEKTLEGVVSNG